MCTAGEGGGGGRRGEGRGGGGQGGGANDAGDVVHIHSDAFPVIFSPTHFPLLN